MALRGSIYIQKLAKLSMRNEIDTQDEDKLSSASILYASMYILYHHVCIFVRDLFSFESMKYIMMNINFHILRIDFSISFSLYPIYILCNESFIVFRCNDTKNRLFSCIQLIINRMQTKCSSW